MATVATVVSIFLATALGVVVGTLLSLWLLVELTKPPKEKD